MADMAFALGLERMNDSRTEFVILALRERSKMLDKMVVDLILLSEKVVELDERLHGGSEEH